MKKFDEIAKMNQQSFKEEVEKGMYYTKPWLDMDRKMLLDYGEGIIETLPRPYMYIYPQYIFKDIESKEVLCLASGGGQQSAVFGLLGARVTVLDATEEQLAGDRKASDHYSYEIKAIHGDMRDLSMLEDESFDLVYQPVSMCFVPDVREVFREVQRVLKPGGIYRVTFGNPATYPIAFEGPDNGWDGTGYRIAEPVRKGPILVNKVGVENMYEGEMIGEFRHLFSDMFNGLINTGFSIQGVYEDPRHLIHEKDAEPGSDEYFEKTVLAHFCVVAGKNNG